MWWGLPVLCIVMRITSIMQCDEDCQYYAIIWELTVLYNVMRIGSIMQCDGYRDNLKVSSLIVLFSLECLKCVWNVHIIIVVDAHLICTYYMYIIYAYMQNIYWNISYKYINISNTPKLDTAAQMGQMCNYQYIGRSGSGVGLDGTIIRSPTSQYRNITSQYHIEISQYHITLPLYHICHTVCKLAQSAKLSSCPSQDNQGCICMKLVAQCWVGFVQ